tara:strand:- start:315 stop:497 length:183 start_codon:yes stop_codon:yes gene_type:complete
MCCRHLAIAQVVNGVRHDGGTVSQPAADKLDNGKADIEKEGPTNTSRGIIVAAEDVIVHR